MFFAIFNWVALQAHSELLHLKKIQKMLILAFEANSGRLPKIALFSDFKYLIVYRVDSRLEGASLPVRCQFLTRLDFSRGRAQGGSHRERAHSRTHRKSSSPSSVRPRSKLLPMLTATCQSRSSTHHGDKCVKFLILVFSNDLQEILIKHIHHVKTLPSHGKRTSEVQKEPPWGQHFIEWFDLIIILILNGKCQL